MARLNFCHLLAIIPWTLGSGMVGGNWLAKAQSPPATKPVSSQRCPASVLSRLVKHQVKPGETLPRIAQQYGLSPATLKGMNPRLRTGRVWVGMNLVVPPYNGILVAVPAGQTLKAVANAYHVSSEVLFEVNGCQLSPKVAFVPGIQWSPRVNAQPTGIAPLRPLQKFSASGRQVNGRDRYPLPQPATVLGTYGWRVNPDTRKMQFYSGIDLQAATGTPVYAVSAGTVVFAGQRDASGQLVIIRHTQGRETRYGRLQNVDVKAGQRVQPGRLIGEVASAPQTALRFEVRYRSSLGWVAHDPQPYLQSLQQ
ncbi:M23 family metallopeptidase [Acaryochloris sp. IP29b_bin.137]|uniref:peptidoglycan DD-metalloendopeptidase family protein n=1 Tax=Acaryochloris sp. IP29b_bin.137 TaxID=2969217 RepID=UPI0026136686|nr:M23 family metallopeptidase [Acaryochloris sp. IP29b_bin.137]